MECIHLHLGPNVLIKTRLNTNTQKNESVNRTLTKQTQSLELGGEHFLAGFTVHAHAKLWCFILDTIQM